jgi:hypothetical protein
MFDEKLKEEKVALPKEKTENILLHKKDFMFWLLKIILGI